ncbi:bifunctional monodehydroascorbate reductase and carbonic anhydrase nectarin-3-like [Hibiscus syriacus]|uniref:Bifunctional monodehydroascorbate reductase and carbonic anhydrase nectarin-3-like n=1 Tax=Hibiscus syriacus TaxID=106335 RepID=A0A6A3CDH1_HIBSY|nr:uncharacterized protein LOC120200838 [Hibiscus syriacus]KAE8726664.1 bifunctional monodehydroascorbate reductase and carbonic anhydrase nectarin-3-like [Hibiscus syriacus]
MRQGNLETLVSAFDNKIVCETITNTEGDSSDGRIHTAEKPLEEEIPPDFPPESFLLSKDAELDWVDSYAFYERKNSQKRNSFSNSTNLNPNPNLVPNSQRFSLRKSKPSILGLPKPHKSCFVDTKNRKNTKPENSRLFPKRSGSVKLDPPVFEPSSPKVSCMGRVRSKRDRNRRFKKNRQKSAGVETVKNKTTRTGSGFFSSFRAIFGCSGKAREPHTLPETVSSPGDSSIRSRLPADAGDSTLSSETEIAETGPVNIGGMKRFVSGRRSEPACLVCGEP